jgi:hypothetical protein
MKERTGCSGRVFDPTIGITSLERESVIERCPVSPWPRFFRSPFKKWRNAIDPKTNSRNGAGLNVDVA